MPKFVGHGRGQLFSVEAVVDGLGMKLLFDQNLSPRLPRLLADLYPNSVHIRELGMVIVLQSSLDCKSGRLQYNPALNEQSEISQTSAFRHLALTRVTAVIAN